MKTKSNYNFLLSMNNFGNAIKEVRQAQKLTQTQLGELIGVKKAQISKLESGLNSATIDTVVKVFNALKTEINFNVKINKEKSESSKSSVAPTKKIKSATPVKFFVREYRDMDID